MRSRKLAVTVTALLCTAVSGVTNANDDDIAIEEVIVTGQKFNRSLQDTPQSVSVIDAQIMQDENLLTLSDVLYRTPNAASTFNGTGFSLRGVRNDNVSGGGFSDLATIFLDGAPLSRDMTFSGTIDIWDLEQVEVLRGPQSTLQGRNSLAGAVILNTMDPTFEWEARGRVQTLSEIDEQRYSVAFGGPIVDQQVAFRVAAEFADSDGPIENTFRNNDYGPNETEMVRAKLLIAPEAIPELEILISHMVDNRTFGGRESLKDAPGSWSNRVIAANRLTQDKAESDLTVANIKYDISDTLDFNWITTYTTSERERVADNDLTPGDTEFSSLFSETDTLTTELRLSFINERWTGVVGLWFSDIDNKTNDLSTVFGFDVIEQFQLPFLLQAPPFNLDAGTAGFVSSFYTDPFLLDASVAGPITVETQALFADFSYEINDAWTLLAGFRFDQEEQAFVTQQDVRVASALPDPALAGPAAPIVAGVNGFLQAQADQANTPGTDDENDFTQFLPKIGISWKFADNQTLSFIAQQGYRSGGVSGNAARARIVQYDEETTLNYELSYRSQWLDNRLTLNANAYFTDWEDQQVNVFLSSNSFDSEVQNAGKSELMGLELETSYGISENFDIYGSVGYAQTEFKEFELQLDLVVDDLSGNEFSRAPEWTVSAGLTWTHPSGWLVNVNANHTSDSFNSASEQMMGPDIPARTIANFRAGWSNENLGVYLVGRNILDDEHFDSVFDNAEQAEVVRYGQPQSFGLTIEANL